MNVGEVAGNIDVACAHYRFAGPGFDRRDLAREIADRKTLALTRSDVVERPRDHDVECIGYRPLRAECLRRKLAHRIGISRAWHMLLICRQLRRGYLAVDIAGADVDHAPGEMLLLERLEEMQSPQKIDLKSGLGIAKRFGNRALCSKVDDHVRFAALDERPSGRRIAQVQIKRYFDELPEPRIGRVLEHLGENSSDKAVAAGDQQAPQGHRHDATERYQRSSRMTPSSASTLSSQVSVDVTSELVAVLATAASIAAFGTVRAPVASMKSVPRCQ